MTGLDEIIRALQTYGGKQVKIMEVCGTHTAAIFKSGIRNLLSPRIKLVSGPGCPVCLACEAYIDKLYGLAADGKTIVASFGDLFKVKGSRGSLQDAKANGGNAELVYSPFEVLEIARKHPEKTVAMAAVGFETTAPLYALLVRSALEQGLSNIRLLTALKRLVPALEMLSAEEIDAFIAPGHVATVIGSDVFEPLAQKFRKPFAVTGFSPENILAALYYLLIETESGNCGVANLYGEAVRPKGNEKAMSELCEFFETGPAYWRGLSTIEDSGYYLKERYAMFDAGSRGFEDTGSAQAKACQCAQVLTGKIDPGDCPLFGKACTPQNAYGPCMVSAEGACGIWYREGQGC
jgi:hydrogenase expression/formation protein HypD